MSTSSSRLVPNAFLPWLRFLAVVGTCVPLTVWATNPGASQPAGKQNGEEQSKSDKNEDPAQGEDKDCEGSEAKKDDSSNPSGNGSGTSSGNGDCGCDPDNGCIKAFMTLGIAPNEPGLGSGMIQLYIDATAPNLGSRDYIEFFGLPQMAVTEVEDQGESFKYGIVQAGGSVIPFSLDRSIPSGQQAVVGKPVGSAAYSQARTTFVDAGGVFTGKSSAASVRHYRGISGFVDYPVNGGNAQRYQTRQGRSYNFPLPGMEVIREKTDGTLVVNGQYENGHLRQVKTVAGLLDVVPLTERSYEIRKYAPEQVGAKTDGLFTVTGEPFLSLKVEAPENTQNELVITKTEGSYVTTSYHTCTVAEGTETWTQLVTSGDFTYERVLSHTPMAELGADYRETVREARFLQTPVDVPSFVIVGGTVYRQATQTYKYAPVSSTQTFSNGASKERTRAFSQPSWDLNGVGRPTSQTTSRGSSINYSYASGGLMINDSKDIARPASGGGAGFASAGKTYSYNANVPGEIMTMGDFRPRTSTVSKGGVAVGKSFFSAAMVNDGYVESKKRSTSANAGFGDASNLLSEKRWYGTGEHKGRIEHERHEDGTMTRYEYATKPNNGLEVTTFLTLDASGNPVTGHSTRSRALRDMRGWPVQITNAAWIDGAWVDYEIIHETRNTAGRLTERRREDLLTSQSRILLQQEWDGPLLTREVDEEGVATSYTYFPGSTIVKTKLREAVPAQGGFDAQPEILTTYSGDLTLNEKQVPEWRQRLTTVTAGSLTTTESHTFDEEGRVVSHTDTNGLTTTTAYTEDDKLITVTLPDGGTRITTLDSDGRTLSITGTAVVAKYFHYAPLAAGGTRTTVYTGVDNGLRYEIIDRDSSDRIVRKTTPSFAGQADAVTEYFYSSAYPKKVVRITRSGQPAQIFDLNSVGATFRRGQSADNATLSPASQTDRISDEIVTHEQDSAGLWEVTRTSVYPDAGSGTAKLVRTSRVKLAGFSGTEIARVEDLDIASNATVKTTTLSGALRTVSVTRPGVTGSEVSTYLADRLMTEAQPGVSGLTVYGYDALGRQISHKDPRHSQVSTTAYVSGKDQIASETDAAGNTTSYSYYPNGIIGAGKIRSITIADNSVKWRAYTQRGELMASWGSQTYPTWREYDAYGQLTVLHTWQTAPTLDADNMPSSVPAGSATTTWSYDPASGLLANKRDAADKGADYSYDIARRLTERKWARSVGGNRLITTYGYHDFGQLETTDYADSTPDVSITYDRLGRIHSIGNGIAGSIYSYDSATLLLDTETVSYDLDGDSTADFTRVLDRSRDANLRNSGWQLKDGTAVENEVEYRYGSAGRFGEIESPAGIFTYGYTPGSNLIETIAGPTHTVTNTWEANRNVLTLKENEVGATMVSSYGYSVNAIGQRTAVSQQGTAFASSRTWDWGYDALGQVTSADHSAENIFDRAFQYDAIGNRIEVRDGVTAVTGTPNYTANELNQYSSIIDPQSTVLDPSYDDDGNATSYPLSADPGNLSTMAWDGENRLISSTVSSTTTTYLYDAQSRRISKTTGGATTLYVYDGWNVIAEYSWSVGVSPALQKVYTWGLDLSESLQGVGGVGGLLAVNEGSNTYFPTYDGNGNVSEYLTAAGTVTAHFEYDPFGNTVVGTDSMGRFRYRFGTKANDAETGLYYYGVRYYEPITGRWLSRDPIAELGGLNIAEFVLNNPVCLIDINGRSFWGSVGNFLVGAGVGALSGALTGAAVGLIAAGPPGVIAGALAGAGAGALAGGVAAVANGGINNNGNFTPGGSASTGAISGGLAGLPGGALGVGASATTAAGLGAVAGGVNDAVSNPHASLCSVTLNAGLGGAFGLAGGLADGLSPLESGLFGAATTLLGQDVSDYSQIFGDDTN